MGKCLWYNHMEKHVICAVLMWDNPSCIEKVYTYRKKTSWIGSWPVLEHPLEAESSGKQSSPEMVCCTIECNKVEHHIGASVVLNAVNSCNGPPEPIFRCSNDHRNLLLSPVYSLSGNIWDKVYGLKPHNSWICKEHTQGRYCDTNSLMRFWIESPRYEKR